MFVHHTNSGILSLRYFIFILCHSITPSRSTTQSSGLRIKKKKRKRWEKFWIKLWLCWLDFFFHYFNIEEKKKVWKHQISTPRWVSYFTIHQSSHSRNRHSLVVYAVDSMLCLEKIFEISSDWVRVGELRWSVDMRSNDRVERRERERTIILKPIIGAVYGIVENFLKSHLLNVKTFLKSFFPFLVLYTILLFVWESFSCFSPHLRPSSTSSWCRFQSIYSSRWSAIGESENVAVSRYVCPLSLVYSYCQFSESRNILSTTGARCVCEREFEKLRFWIYE